MPSIFTKIINNQIPSYKLYEDEDLIAILDNFPTVIGHTLIIPKVEIDYWADLPDELVLKINNVAKKIAKSLSKALAPIRVGQIVIGLEVPHYHLHLVPIFDNNFSFEVSHKKLKPTESEFLELQSKIKGFL